MKKFQLCLIIFLSLGLCLNVSAQWSKQLKDLKGRLIPTKKVVVTNKTAQTGTTSPSTSASAASGTTVYTQTVGGKKSELKRNIGGTSVTTTPINTTNSTLGCVTKRVKAEVGMKDLAIFTNNSNIYPFSIIDGKTILTGAYATKNFKRNPIVLISDLPVANPNDAAVVVQEPSKANIEKAMVELRGKQLGGSQAAKITFSVKEVESVEDLKLHLNVHAEGFWNTTIDNKFSFSESKSSFTFLADFEQLYYSINVDDIPTNPKDIFAEDIGVMPTDLVYVSSVTFGRKAVLAITVNNVTKTIADQLKVAVQSGLKKIEGDAGFELRKALKNTTISGIIFGGNAQQAAEIIGGTPEQVISKLNTFIKQGAVFNKDNPGAPLYYTMNFVNDNSICGVFQSLDKNVRKCQDAFRFRVKPIEILAVRTDDGRRFGGPIDRTVEIYGCIAMKIYSNGGHTYETSTHRDDPDFNTEPIDMAAIWRKPWKTSYHVVSQGNRVTLADASMDRIVSIPRASMEQAYFEIITNGNFPRGPKNDMGVNEADDGDDDDWPLNPASFSKVYFSYIMKQPGSKLLCSPIFETPGNKVVFYFECEYLNDK